MAVVGLAWPVLVTLTPAADRPWISGTADNSIWSLIFNYNGAGPGRRPDRRPGGRSRGGFGGRRAAVRRQHRHLSAAQTALGDQAGWLLGFAIVAGLALLVLTRLRRRDPRTGWLIAVGGAFADDRRRVQLRRRDLPSLLRLVPGAVRRRADRRRRRRGRCRSGGRGGARCIAPLAILAGAVTELVVLGTLGGALVGQAAA